MMQKDIYEKLISFLLGASWAIVLVGALVVFKTFLSFSFSFALLATVFYVIVSLFLILLLDSFGVNKARLREAKKQTELLEKIYEEKSKSIS